MSQISRLQVMWTAYDRNTATDACMQLYEYALHQVIMPPVLSGNALYERLRGL